VKPTPPPLKWLAEKRGRVLSQLTKAESVLEEQNRRVAKLQLAAASARDRVGRLQADLDALDRTVSVYDSLLDPSEIAPINGWQGRYGKRGALGDRILEIIERGAPSWVQTDVIEALVVAELQLTFETPLLRKQWREGSFKSRLRRLTQEGVLERLQDPTVRQRAVGHWRLRQEKTPTLAELKAASLVTAPVS
jgi:hypothetical protein